MNFKQPALLALDLDGTILDDSEQLVPGLVDEVQRWRESGWKVAIITARWRVTEVMLPLKADAIALNYGARLLIGGVEQCRALLAEAVATALRHVPAGSRLLVMTAQHCFREQPNWPTDRSLSALSQSEEVLKVYVQHPDSSVVKSVLAHWEVIPDTTPLQESADKVILLAAGVDKGKALLTVADTLGVVATQSLAIGDGAADAEMMRRVGTFVRVGRHPLLAAAACHVSRPDDVPALLAHLRQRG